MPSPRTQHLTEAFNSIIQMMLASLRVGGWRALLDLPQMIIAAIYLRRLGREFAALIAAFQAGTLPLQPASRTDPQPAATSCPTERSRAAPNPHRAAALPRARAATRPHPALPPKPRVARRAPTWPRHQSDRIAVLALPAAIIASARST